MLELYATIVIEEFVHLAQKKLIERIPTALNSIEISNTLLFIITNV